MKYNKILRTLAIASTLALLAATIPLTTALAQVIQLSPIKGEIGDSISVFGQNFPDNQLVYIYFSSERAYENDRLNAEVNAYQRVKTTQAGLYGTLVDVIDDYFLVPEELSQGNVYEKVRGGTYYVYITYSATPTVIRAWATFTVESIGEITLDPNDGTVGTEVDVSGVGFDNREDITVEYDGDEVTIESGDDATDRDGEFEFTILIPNSTAGDHTITVIGDDSLIEAEAEFTVEPEITISPESGTSGDTITVSGTGFGDRIDFSIFFDDVEVIADESTNRKGSFEATFAALSRQPGSYDVEAEDEDNNSDKVKFTIATTAASLSPSTGYAGIEVTVSGSGFQANKSITITFDNETVKTASTDSYGKFSAIFTVPTRVTGTYKVRVGDGTSTAEANFVFSTGASISPVTSSASPGYVGTELTISGVGFIVGRTVTITYDGSQLAPATVLADGTFSATFNAPASSGGAHTIIATDATNTKQFTFVMESTPPPIPAPLKPEMGIKAEAEAYFDWEDVTDSSGVTYTLQIATENFTSESFSQDSIVLEKTGLTQSEYTITKEEKLESVSEETPYYWHVKAVDGAFNESQWTGTRAFYVGGFAFSLSQPVIYTLLGVGALLFAIFTFWLGRKTAYY